MYKAQARGGHFPKKRALDGCGELISTHGAHFFGGLTTVVDSGRAVNRLSERWMLKATSCGRNCVTGPLCGEFTADRWIPRTKASGAEFWCFLWFAPWINGGENNCETGDLRRDCAHYDVTVTVYLDNAFCHILQVWWQKASWVVLFYMLVIHKETFYNNSVFQCVIIHPRRAINVEHTDLTGTSWMYINHIRQTPHCNM